MKNQTARHAFALGCLDEVPARQGDAVEQSENEEAADEPFRVAHGDRFGRQSAGDEETGQEDCRRGASLHSGNRISRTEPGADACGPLLVWRSRNGYSIAPGASEAKAR